MVHNRLVHTLHRHRSIHGTIHPNLRRQGTPTTHQLPESDMGTMNKRGKTWDFPNHTSREELEALYKAKIAMLEQTIERLENELQLLKESRDEDLEIIDAEIVEPSYLGPGHDPSGNQY